MLLGIKSNTTKKSRKKCIPETGFSTLIGFGFKGKNKVDSIGKRNLLSLVFQSVSEAE